MKLPRDLDGVELAQALGNLGYVKIRQTGFPVSSILNSTFTILNS